MKLVLREREEGVLRAELAKWEGYVSSALLPLGDTLLDEATALQPPVMRSLDALHLATALSVRDDIGAFFCYDQRLAEAADRHGLPVARPGSS